MHLRRIDNTISPMDKIVIGLTGAIGAGKSAVAGLMAEKGYRIIVADAVGHEVLTLPEIKTGIRKLFGDEVFDKYGEILRTRLAAIVFADKWTTKRFNRLVHPPLLAELKRLCDIESNDVVLEAALLFEWGDDVEYDISVCVDAPEELRRERTTLKYSDEDFSSRQMIQLPASRKVEMADIVLTNDGTIEELRDKVDRLIEYLDAFKATDEISTELVL